MKLKLTGKELRAIGFPEGPVISVAMNVMMLLESLHQKLSRCVAMHQSNEERRRIKML
jgi:hypothetical protein